jgi:myosin heavy subunit
MELRDGEFGEVAMLALAPSHARAYSRSMSTMQRIRETVDAKLDEWKAQLAAFEDQLRLGQDQAVERLHEQRRRLEDEAAQIRAWVEDTTSASDDAKSKLRASFDRLKVQLALGRAEGRAALEEQRSKLDEAIAAFESDFDRAVQEATADSAEAAGDLQRGFLRSAQSVRAEYEALALRFEEGGERAQAEFERRRDEVAHQIRELKATLESKRSETAERWGELKDEVQAGVSKIRDAFSGLFRS